MSTNDGGSAFPTKVITGTEYIENVGNRHTYDEYPGMTLRDYFAAKAMQGFCSGPDYGLNPNTINKRTYEENTAFHAYNIADAMLKAREQ
jgi:hypothetical protein